MNTTTDTRGERMYNALQEYVKQDVFRNSYHTYTTEIIMQMVSCVSIGNTELFPECTVLHVMRLLEELGGVNQVESVQRDENGAEVALADGKTRTLHAFLAQGDQSDRLEMILIHVRQEIKKVDCVTFDRFKQFQVFREV
jgi:hypothetical protein